MSTSKPFTYPVTVVAYRDPKYTGGVAELYVNNRYHDWTTLFDFNPDMSNREALEENNGDLIDMLDFDEDGEVEGVKPGREDDCFEWAFADLVEGGYVLDAGLYFDASLRHTFGENVSSNLGESCNYWVKAENGALFAHFTLESPEPLEFKGEKIRHYTTYPRPA